MNCNGPAQMEHENLHRIKGKWGRWIPFVAVLGIFFASPASAYWEEPSEVVEGTAYNLRKGEFSIGFFAPLQYGITDELTVVIHPILELLLTPNIGLRAEVYEGPVTINLTGNYLQTFLGRDDGGGYPGQVEGGLVVSAPFGSQWILTGFAGLSQSFHTLTSRTKDFVLKQDDGELSFGTRRVIDDIHAESLGTGFLYRLGVNWVISRRHMLMAQFQGESVVEVGRDEGPQGTFMWALAWERVRLSAGIALGKFPFRTFEDRIIELPVYPLFDVWIRI